MRKSTRIVGIGLGVMVALAAGLSPVAARGARGPGSQPHVEWLHEIHGSFGTSPLIEGIDARTHHVDIVSTSQRRGEGMVVASYTSRGHRLWIYRAPRDSQRIDTAVAIAVDSRNHRLYILAHGYSAGHGDDGDVGGALIAMSSSGKRLWTRSVSTAWTGGDNPAVPTGPVALVLDPARHRLYAAGLSSTFQAQTIALTLTGRRRWAHSYAPHDGCLSIGDVVDPRDHHVVTEAACNVYAAPSFVTLNYGPAGALRWRRDLRPKRFPDVVASGLATDPGTGSIVVTGTAIKDDEQLDSPSEWFTVRYGRHGHRLWTRTLGPAHHPHAVAEGMGIDPADGAIEIAGFTAAAKIDKFVVQRLSRSGTSQWINRRHTICSNCEGSHATIAIDPRTHQTYATYKQVEGSTYVYGLTLKGHAAWREQFSEVTDPGALAVDAGADRAVATGFTDSADIQTATLRF